MKSRIAIVILVNVILAFTVGTFTGAIGYSLSIPLPIILILNTGLSFVIAMTMEKFYYKKSYDNHEK
jgi:hypothetical protein